MDETSVAWGQVIKRVTQVITVVALLIGAYYVLRFVVFAIIWVNILRSRDFMDASATNTCGDVASAETNFFGAPEHRVKTVIRLHRAGHWFSTTLVDPRSWEVLVGLKWRDDDILDVRLDFGCKPQMEPPVTITGAIRIVYHWGDPGHVPKGGYESFRRRDLPPEPCP